MSRLLVACSPQLGLGTWLCCTERCCAGPMLQANEPLGPSLLTIHNIHFMAKMMEQLRQRILNDEL